MGWGLLLLLLICPIMMMFMMKGHNYGSQHNHGKHDNNHTNEIVQLSNEVGRMDSYKVKQLEGELDLLKRQNESLQQELNKH